MSRTVDAVLGLVREVLMDAGVSGVPGIVALEGVAAALVTRGLSPETARMTVRLALELEASARGVARPAGWLR